VLGNNCGSGYCSKGYSHKEVEECIAKAEPDWNGLCTYQFGRFIKSPDDEIKLTCCERGCTCPAYEYAGWNGLCSYQKTATI
jgi:hypothetical protein